MSRSKSIIIALAVAVTLSACPQDAQAGPLMDWFKGIRCRREARQNARLASVNQNCSTCPTPPVVNTSLQVPNVAGLQPGQCMKTCNQVCSRTVVNYVPCTAYRTAWSRVPVTQYKPVTNSDPCTGCTVTCMRPCTTYTWQMKREPYTTYRPVYRQENYTVPVTTITNDCATGACNTCPTSTCPTPAIPTSTCPTCPTTAQVITPGSSQGFITPGNNTDPPGTYYTNPGNGTIDTNGGFQVPAETVPAIDSSFNPQKSQRPVINRFDTEDTTTSGPLVEGPLETRAGIQGDSGIRSVSKPSVDSSVNEGWMNSAPRYTPPDDLTAQSPVRKRWSYTPVRLASYTTTQAESESGPIRITGEYQPPVPAKNRTASQPRKVNAGWETVEW